MNYQIEFTPFRSYLRVDIAGKRRPGMEAEDAMVVWGSISDRCNRLNLKKTLVVWHLIGPVTTIDAFDLWNNTELFGWDMSIKVAAVFLDEAGLETNRFAETVATNRGVFGKLFGNIKEAGAWLLSE